MKHTVATLDGVFVRNAKTGLYAPYDTSTKYPCRLFIWIALDIAAAALLGGAGYALVQAWQALAG